MQSAVLALLVVAHSVAASAQSERDAVATYDIAVRWVNDSQRLDVEARVTLPAPAPEAGAASPTSAGTLTFQLDRRCSDPEVTIRDGSDITSAAASAPTVARSGDRLAVSLPTLSVATVSGKPRVLQFRYSIASARARSFYVTGEHAFVSGEAFAWYPRETSSRRSKGRLRFALADGFIVASTGRHQPAGKAIDEGSREGSRTSQDFIVNDATTFSFAAARHRVVTQTGAPDLALHLLRERPLASERLAALRRIVDALVQEFGSFPHPDLEVVEMPAAAAGGRDAAVSLEGFVVVGPGVMDSFTLAVVGHEVGHQWWADCVFGAGPNSVLLTEAMAQYGALRATRTIHGDAAAAEYRWRGYPGESLLAGERGYLSVVLAGLDGPLTAPHQAPTLPATKGMLAHDLFSRTVGEEKFRTFLQQFVRTHAFSDVTWDMFVDEAIAAFGEQTRVIVRKYYDEKDVPELTWWSDERIAATAVVAPLGRAMHLARTGGSDFLTAAKETLTPSADAPPERLFILEALLADDALERGDHERARTHLRAALEAPAVVREFLPALYYYQAWLASVANDRELMTRAAAAAIDTDAKLIAPTGWSLAARELLILQRVSLRP